jgi:antirestriction protein ArdC/phage/plasmid primase-like uncharacterized protein
MTYNQAQNNGMGVLHGSKATTVVFYQFAEEQERKGEDGKPILDKDGKPQKQTVELERPIIRFAKVFNGEQIDGMPPLQLTDKAFEWEPVDKAESILSASGADIRHDQSDRAFYRIATDSIHLPPKENFDEPGKYYGTALHELGHWTRHETRLNRENGPFGSELYAREELRAEIASWMLGQDIGIAHDPGQHVAYVQSWVKALEEDPLEIQRACRDAEQIKEYVLGLERKQEVTLSPEKTLQPEREEGIAAMALPPLPANGKTFLTVPYAEKEAVKALGAKWDKQEKSWFAPEGTDLAPLKNWLPVENVRLFVWPETDFPDQKERFSVQTQQAGLWAHVKGPDDKPLLFEKEEDALVLQRQFRQAAPALLKPLSPQEEFALTLQKAGLDLQGQAPLMDGEIQRVPLLGKGLELNGAYCGYLDENPPAGLIQNFSSGEKTQWIATGHVLSEEQREIMRREREQQKVDLEERFDRIHNNMAAEAFELVREMDVASPDHPFLKEREVEPFGVHQEQDTLYVPLRNKAGYVRNLNIIESNGDSRFLIGAEKEGCFHFITGPDQYSSNIDPKEIAQGEIVLSQGYASGASLHMATGKPVAVAFTADNLEPVARALRERFPQAEITICADNNQYARTDGTVQNRGVMEAERAAEAVGGRVIVPEFTDTEKTRGLVDFNELHVSRGLEEVTRQVGLALDNAKLAGKELGEKWDSGWSQDKNPDKDRANTLERGMEL